VARALIFSLFASTALLAAPRRPEGVTAEIEHMVARGADYLVRTQNRDGSWNNMGGYGAYPTAMTALAGTGLLATGSTPTRGPHSRGIAKAAEFLLRLARPDGLIASPAEDGRSLHGHGFAMLFLAEVYGMEQDADWHRRLHDALTRAVRITERCQSRAGGWYYTPNMDGDEGSVTVTQIQGLRACRDAGIQVSATTVRNAVRYIERSANADGGIRYQMAFSGGSQPAITAAAVATLYNAGNYDYSQLYYAQAKYQRGGSEWARYYRAISQRLAQAQNGDGSWNGDQVGTSYGTAIALIILQLPYQYVPIYQR
jgi:hypothetical protein